MAKPKNPDQDPHAVAFARAVSIRDCFETAKKLFDSGIFTKEGARHPLFQAAVVHLLICLNDMAQKAAVAGARIDSSEWVDLLDGVKDVTDLISKCRNVACHIGSPLQNIDTIRFRFNVAAGIGSGLVLDGEKFDCEFADDIAVFYGHHRLYLGRHAMATLTRLRDVFAKELSDDWMKHVSTV